MFSTETRGHVRKDVSPTMILAIDIGNSSTTCGLFHQNKLLKRFSFPTSQPARYSTSLKQGMAMRRPEAVIIASVVPRATTKLQIALKYLGLPKIIVLGKDAIVPVKNRYRLPKQVGQDRLVNAYAAVKLYGAPAIVIDYGTAITFDVISAKNEYLGGMIVPGMCISLEALTEKTALLPRIKLSKPKEFIGRDTASSMLSGIFYGFGALTDDLNNRISRTLGHKTRIIGTGGNISQIKPFCHSLQHIDQDLTLKGLNLLYHNGVVA